MKDPKSAEVGLPRATTQEIEPILKRAAPGGCVLYASAGAAEDGGRSLRLETGEAVIGRGDECNLVLRDGSVSRRHARLAVTPDGILVEDLGSRNGTTYLGKRISRITVHVGARIGVGNCSVDLLPLERPGGVPVSTRERYGRLLGASLPMRRVYSVLEAIEGSDAPVLVEGETGTGKDLLARSLHEKGARKDMPFVVIDCGNVPTHLMESELFGHCKGSFTGAVADRAGAFEAADMGTVFLDEVGELPLDLQPKLLRVLETQQIKRLGDVRHSAVDVRVIAATSRDLCAEVEAGRFRDDLYYRLAVIRLKLPPLRDRVEDVPLLAGFLAGELSGGKVKELSEEILEMFMRHDWPGNVRELRNAVQRVLMLGVVDPEIAGDGRARAPMRPRRRAARTSARDASRRWTNSKWRSCKSSRPCTETISPPPRAPPAWTGSSSATS
ncbi:MAG: sigma 54-dependent Fis family transcriptional regulator [Deltaproteobacteria bacterium]|nr:sigma 54-dependent Fis family transcriptional regulator [Deltaproteobacteria bacterium]